MFNDKKKICLSIIFLFIVCILSLNGLHASDVDENISLPYENREVEITSIFENNNIENDSKTNNTLKDNFNVVKKPNLNQNSIVYYIPYENAIKSDYSTSAAIIVSVATSSNLISGHSSSANSLDYLLIGSFVSEFSNNLMVFTSDSVTGFFSNDNDFVILINDMFDLENNNGLNDVFNNYLIGIDENTFILFINVRNNSDFDKFLNQMFYGFLYNYQKPKPDFITENNSIINTENSVNIITIEKNQAIGINEYVTSDIFIVPDFVLSNDSLIESHYFNLITIHSRFLYPVISIGGLFKNRNNHNIHFFDIYGSPLVNSFTTFEINGISYSNFTDCKGKISLAIDLNEDYALNNINCDGNSAIYYSVLENGFEDFINFHNFGKKCYVTILDYDQSPIINTLVKIELDGVFYSGITNNKGIFSFDVDMSYGKHLLTITHPLYNMKIDKFVESVPILKGYDIILSHKDKASYKVKLVDDYGVPVSGATISMEIDDVFYGIFTDNNGVASLDINLNPGHYIVTSIYNEFIISNEIIVK